jgi:CRP-like cAMP-binding protein
LNIYDEAIEALLNHDPELAIHLIRQTQNELRELQEQKQQPLIEVEKATDFLNFNGWEAA